jgi:inner membrane transporter RhtA
MAVTTLTRRSQLPAPAVALSSLVVLQLGTALATTLFRSLGTAGTSWLTLAIAGVCFIAIAPRALTGLTGAGFRNAVALGAVTAGVSLTFMASLHRLPLGTASAVEFLGPLSIPVLRARSARALAWPVLAGGGVALLTHPWQHLTDPLGVVLALLAAVFWAAYILLAQRSGDHHQGVGALAIALPVAAVLSAPWGAPGAIGHLDAGRLAVAAVVALLNVVAPYTLELVALRRMNVSAFGTLMCFEPAIGTGVGVILLGQPVALGQLAGVAMIVTAGLGATRSAGRRPDPADHEVPTAAATV